MENKAVAVIHFQPLEKYPPIMNFIAVLQEQVALKSVNIFTTYCPLPDCKLFQVNKHGFVILRYGSRYKTKIFNYLSFNLKTYFKLIKERPGIVIYYESISAFPALFYKLFFPRVKLMIHYHEYVSPEEYKNGMRLVRRLHILERKFYQKASWISQTNEDRLKLFQADEHLTDNGQFYVQPNFPPQKWVQAIQTTKSTQLQIVYVGAVSIQTMYIKEFAAWVIKQNGKILWHIYTNNITNDAKEFLNNLSSDYITLMGAVEYDDLPAVLGKYQVGVILYKGHIPNYIYNAPNKFFEYLALGLDVWFPHHMISCKPFVFNDGKRPVVSEINFSVLNRLNPADVIANEKMEYRQNRYFAEEALHEQILFIKQQI